MNLYSYLFAVRCNKKDIEHMANINKYGLETNTKFLCTGNKAML